MAANRQKEKLRRLNQSVQLSKKFTQGNLSNLVNIVDSESNHHMVNNMQTQQLNATSIGYLKKSVDMGSSDNLMASDTKYSSKDELSPFNTIDDSFINKKLINYTMDLKPTRISNNIFSSPK